VSGHSKWSSIKHKKGAADAKRGALFTKLTRAITVAAREGGGDIEGNPSLSLAVQKARDNSMPKDNIERAINKGTGADQDADAFERIVYEGYGPGGVALLVDALTDNRNRTGSEVRHTFSKFNGSLGEPGSVNYLFERKGELVVDASLYSEDDLMAAIDAGAEDVAQDGDVFEVITEHTDLTSVREALEQAGVQIQSAEIRMRPTLRTPVEEGDAGTLMKLIDALEENDDVQAVHGNFDVDDAVLERVASAG
jgi:YebC/PmpR family DNA-binding regulatory protein